VSLSCSHRLPGSPALAEQQGIAMLAMFGPLELFVVALVILLLFGNRLPSVMRSMGQGMLEFKKGVQGVDEEPEDLTKNAR